MWTAVHGQLGAANRTQPVLGFSGIILMISEGKTLP